jgi:hypothetical protein
MERVPQLFRCSPTPELNATGRRKLPEDAPTEFLPQRLKPIVINHGEIDRRERSFSITEVFNALIVCLSKCKVNSNESMLSTRSITR